MTNHLSNLQQTWRELENYVHGEKRLLLDGETLTISAVVAAARLVCLVESMLMRDAYRLDTQQNLPSWKQKLSSSACRIASILLRLI